MPLDACTANGCERNQVAKGFCLMHYKRWKRTGDANAVSRQPRAGRLCAVEGCDRPVLAKGYCNTHYLRQRAHGDPLFTARMGPEPVPLEKRYKVDPDTGCWIFDGAPDKDGYGNIRHDGKVVKAHRLAAHLWLDFDLDDPRQIRHSCDNPPCINPEHLLPGTRADNARDMVERGRQAKTQPHWKLVLTFEQVEEMRRRWAIGASQSELAREYGVTQGLVSRIVHRKVRLTS